jgi:hypothetical protein
MAAKAAFGKDRELYCWCELHGGPADGFMFGESLHLRRLQECTRSVGLFESIISEVDPNYKLSFPHLYVLVRDDGGRVRQNAHGLLIYEYAGDDRVLGGDGEDF